MYFCINHSHPKILRKNEMKPVTGGFFARFGFFSIFGSTMGKLNF